MTDARRFYKEIGNLFYAIAAVDKIVSPLKKKKLEEEVQLAWRHYDHSTDRFGSDRAFLIEFEFETMEDEMVPPEDAYLSFENYYMENKNQINKTTRNRIFKSACHIAESYRKTNIAEHKYLIRLKKLMNI